MLGCGRARLVVGQHEPDTGFSLKHSQIPEGNAQYHPAMFYYGRLRLEDKISPVVGGIYLPVTR